MKEAFEKGLITESIGNHHMLWEWTDLRRVKGTEQSWEYLKVTYSSLALSSSCSLCLLSIPTSWDSLAHNCSEIQPLSTLISPYYW